MTTSDPALFKRGARGVNHRSAKITPDIVRAIRAEPRLTRAVVYKYGLCKRNLQKIRALSSWGWVQ